MHLKSVRPKTGWNRFGPRDADQAGELIGTTDTPPHRRLQAQPLSPVHAATRDAPTNSDRAAVVAHAVATIAAASDRHILETQVAALLRQEFEEIKQQTLNEIRLSDE